MPLKKRSSVSARILLLSLLFLDASAARAEGGWWPALSGTLTGGYWSHSRNLDNEENLFVTTLGLKGVSRAGEAGSLHAEGWVMDEGLFNQNNGKGMLREGYLDISEGPFDLRIGKQVLAWGRADQINPTDNLSPRDYTLLFSDDNDQRIGSSGIKLSAEFSGLVFQGYWLPFFKPDRIPLPSSASFSVGETEPENAFGDWGIKLEYSGSAGDGSLSYYDGYDLFPDVGPGITGGPDLMLSHHRIRTIGMDGAAVVGRFGLRGEAAYTQTENPDGFDPFIKSPFIFMVVGGERTYLEYLNVNIQFLVRSVFNYHDPEGEADPAVRSVAVQESLLNNELDASSQGMTLRVGDKWMNETLEAECAVIYMFTRHDYLIRPKASYAITDNWKVLAAADIFRGPAESYFGYLADNSTAVLELSYHF